MEPEDAILAEARRESDKVAKDRDRLKSYIIWILLIITSALAGSNCTLWTVGDKISVNAQGIATNSMRYETLMDDNREIKELMKALNAKQEIMNESLIQLREAVK